MEQEELIKELLNRIEKLEKRVDLLEGKKEESIKSKPARGTYTKLVVDYINNEIEKARKEGRSYVELVAIDVQKAVGLKNRLPLVCNAMRKCMDFDSFYIHKTPSYQSSTLTIRWVVK